MAGKAGFKAGLIGAGVLLVLTLAPMIQYLVPQAGFLGCVCCGLELLVYAGAGVLGAYYLAPPRAAGPGAGAGAIAGLVSGVGAGLGQTVTSVVGQATGATAQQTQEMMRQLAELGLFDPGMIPASQAAGWGGVATASIMCCLGSLAIGAALGAVGGAILAAAKAD
jgi:hypothetical protein